LSTKSDRKAKHIAEHGQYWQVSTQLEAVFRAFPDVLFLMDSEGVILDYRAGDLSLLYMPPDQFLGKRMQDVLPPEAADLLIKAIENVKKTDEVCVLKYQLQTLQGERWFDARLVQTTDAQIIVVARDVTEHELTIERARQQLRQLSALHAIDAAITASFDLKVTLSVILREILNQLRVDAADILLFNPHSHMLEFAAGQGFRNLGFKHSPVRIGQGFAGTAALERRTVSTSSLNNQTLGINSSFDLEREEFVSYYAVPLLAKGQIKGVMEIYHRQPLQPAEPWLEFLATLASQAALAIDSGELFQNLQKTGTELGLAYDLAIEGWSQALEISGRENLEHIRRVVKLTVEIAQQLEISDTDIVHMRRGALLHDVGNLGIPEAILFKTGSLSADEWAIIHEHPRLGARMLQSIPYLTSALNIPRCHHERWDGSGYPDGLRGEQIPLAARIFAVADVFDAITSSRPYRPAWTHVEAEDYICQQAAKLFDPTVVKAFLKII
jgi:HD-GYP domain-containing protein (c-di-GMP phosphodiesterase class II)